jgi:ribosome biogenesis GTPase
LRRAQKEWIKGNRARANRIDADDESIQGGHGKMRPKAVSFNEATDLEEMARGQVVETVSGRYDVKLDETDTVLCCNTKRGASTENDRSTLVAVGDYVRVQPLEEGRGLIVHVEERRSHLGRNVAGREVMEQVIAANVDNLLCIAGADRPDFRRTILDRYIVAAHLGNVQPVVVLNKIDAVNDELMRLLHEELEIYEQLGYPTYYVSALADVGMDQMRETIGGATNVLVGQSGVGKSTIANALLGYEARRTSQVRESDKRGTHTTISSVILPLPDGGALIDTPGIREFGIWDLEPEELDGYFVEFEDFLQQCRYLPCTHTHEPDCAVQAAVEEGLIDEGRFMSYLSIFESLQAARRR